MIFTDTFWLWLEYFGVATGFIYLWLEIRQKPSMWLLGAISSLLYIFIFAASRIYADMGFNIYNFIISIYGFYQWRRSLATGKIEHNENSIPEYTRMGLQQFLRITSATVLIYGVIYTVLREMTDSPIPAGDAFTTTLSIVATWMLARRIIEHWFFWIVVNIVSVYLYYKRGLYPTMFLYTFYAGMAFVGYYLWKKKGKCYAKK